MRGIQVVVKRPSEPTENRLGEKVAGEVVSETVKNVLVGTPATADLEAARENGDTISLTLHFPKTYTANLRRCSVELPAPWAGVYRVIGDPLPLMDCNTPTAWNRPVNVEVCNG